MGMFTGYKKTASVRSQKRSGLRVTFAFFCARLSALNASKVIFDDGYSYVKTYGNVVCIKYYSTNAIPISGVRVVNEEYAPKMSLNFIGKAFYNNSNDWCLFELGTDGMLYVKAKNNNSIISVGYPTFTLTYVI